MTDGKNKSKSGVDKPATEAVSNQDAPQTSAPASSESTQQAESPTPGTAEPVAELPDAAISDETDESAAGEPETVALSKVPARAAEPETVAEPVAEVPRSTTPKAGPRRIPARGESAVPQPAAQPHRVGAAPTPDRPRGSKRWLAALLAAAVLVAALVIAGFVYLSRDRSETSPEAQIRTSITAFTQALSSGDLATLRAGSCGDLAAYYRDIPDAEFADVHRIAVEQGNLPVVDGVDAVQITDDTAIAQVIAYTAADPASRSPRTFDLRFDDEEWKICSPQVG